LSTKFITTIVQRSMVLIVLTIIEYTNHVG
jgi:hypothetical protein